jgi:predicted GH43/DUF377 family glycosyl hydrolase
MKTFKKNPANPIYGNKETGTLFDVLVQKCEPEECPAGLTSRPARFRMDFSWRPKSALAVAFSDDGTHWSEPLITLACNPASGWEDRINRNCVVKIGDKYQMWYTGQARGYSFIGAAESDDGLNFRRIGLPTQYSTDGKDVLDPVLISERHWEGMSVMNPCVLYENGRYRMYYAAGETYEPNVLALAESEDGIHWTKDRINPIYVCDKGHSYESNRVGGCQVLRVDGLGYLMFYIGYRDIHTACICVALSEDGRTCWRRFKGNPLVTPTSGEWDADSCYKPSALYDEQLNGWRIWYNGRRGNEEYIGEAFMEGTFSESDFE